MCGDRLSTAFELLLTHTTTGSGYGQRRLRHLARRAKHIGRRNDRQDDDLTGLRGLSARGPARTPSLSAPSPFAPGQGLASRLVWTTAAAYQPSAARSTGPAKFLFFLLFFFFRRESAHQRSVCRRSARALTTRGTSTSSRRWGGGGAMRDTAFRRVYEVRAACAARENRAVS